MKVSRLVNVQSILLLFIIGLNSVLFSHAYAQTESEAVRSTKEQREFDRVNREIKDLAESLKLSTGDQKDAIQFRLFNKNNELREIIATGVDNNALPKAVLIAQVALQQEYTEGAKAYLEDKIKKTTEKFNAAKDEEKLSILNTYRELLEYLDSSYESSWQNLMWLQKLGEPNVELEQASALFITKRMRLVSASIEYFDQQLQTVATQISVAPDSEKSALQMTQLITTQRLSIETDSLQKLIVLGDDMGLETSEYKRQIFQVTGSITQDILNVKVLLSLVNEWWNAGLTWLADNAPQQLFQLFIFILILMATRMIVKLVRKVVSKAVVTKNFKLSHLMQNFFVSISGNIVWIIGIMVGLSQIGLNLAPVLTGFGIAGVIIGFALQDTLSNFAAGMMLLIYRPFDVGDFVFAGGVDGKVSHMSLVSTTIRTFDNQIIIVPNGKIWGDVIKNVTHERIRRVDMIFGIGYSDDLLKAESVLTDIVTSHPSVLKSPEPIIKVHTLNTSSVDFIVRPWVKTDDYWDVYWDVTKEVKLRFDREGISIPFPQQDVHLHMIDKKDA
ncbi:mechanosensitive ion channel family protein [Vibrio methylphosphonaticus]|uniref:mechanosensitive ion channel family protein n=1 Tax=Vibrio methylphosphonaticus TaxID=2946866 RepID=UPI00202A724B|nr:mechanosensitive ion channel family protein [Vibrio methylphosphonaticus]MCL9774971.1 mechanosensitive ion channel family protein [Vibrio methylphosphonaticus]